MATAAAAYVERRGWTTAHTVLLGLIVVAIGVVGISLPASGGQLGFIGERAVLAWLLIAMIDGVVENDGEQEIDAPVEAGSDLLGVEGINDGPRDR